MKPTRVYYAGSAGGPAEFPKDGRSEIAFAGRSNVGKSSLINSLVSIKGLARTSRTPGKTQVINFFRADESYYLVDLPGYGYAAVPLAIQKHWQPLIESYFLGRSTLRLVFLIVDARRDPLPSDLQMKRWLKHHAIPHQIVATKADKLAFSRQQSAQRRLQAEFACKNVVLYSALTGLGKEIMQQMIRRHIHPPKSADASEATTPKC